MTTATATKARTTKKAASTTTPQRACPSCGKSYPSDRKHFYFGPPTSKPGLCAAGKGPDGNSGGCHASYLRARGALRYQARRAGFSSLKDYVAHLAAQSAAELPRSKRSHAKKAATVAVTEELATT